MLLTKTRVTVVRKKLHWATTDTLDTRIDALIT